jgi:hypothetical protein
VAAFGQKTDETLAAEVFKQSAFVPKVGAGLQTQASALPGTRNQLFQERMGFKSFRFANLSIPSAAKWFG